MESTDLDGYAIGFIEQLKPFVLEARLCSAPYAVLICPCTDTIALDSVLAAIAPCEAH